MTNETTVTTDTKTPDAPLRVVIIGGVAGGASAAARLRRLSEKAEIIMLERGPDVSFANCGLPYHIGGEIADRSRLAVQTPQSLKELLNIDVRTRTEATCIDADQKSVRIKNMDTGTEENLSYDKLLLSPGASPIRPPLEGIDDPRILTLRNLQDMDRIKERAQQAAKVLVIGAGFIGLEMAEQLIHLGKKVMLAEMADQVLPVMDAEMVRPVEQELRDNGVELFLGDGIQSFHKEGDNLKAKLKSGRTMEADLVVLSIGVKPETHLAKEAGLEIGPRGHIVVNEYQQTSNADIYAAGDAVQTRDLVSGDPTAVPLGGPANRQGRLAADHIVRGSDGVRPYQGSLGTAIVRVFDMAAATTGWTEKRLKQANRAFLTTTISDFQHASYFPGAQYVTLKLLWDPADGRLLGAQAFGVDGVDKRIDIIATAIKGGMTIDDLAELELAYAPPFGAAKDPINIVGYSAQNIRDGFIEPVAELPEEAQILDVRPAAMAELSTIPEAKNIPFTELRDRLAELDRSKPVVTVCNLGKTSYFAARVLTQNGFEAQSYTGGIKASRQPDKLRCAPTQKDTCAGGTCGATSKAAVNANAETVQLDATGIACPGPIMRVRQAVQELESDQVLEVRASDGGFASDIRAFCQANGLDLLSVSKEKGIVSARIQKATIQATPASSDSTASGDGATLVVFSGELDKALASLVIANGAAAMGGKVTLFFTFWGLNVLRRDNPPALDKSFMDKMFGWMLPRGVNKLPLSKMHFFGAGTAMMKDRMKSKNLPSLPGLLADAQKAGVRMVACSMSMEAMGIREEELIDGVEIGGVADYLGASRTTATNLFI